MPTPGTAQRHVVLLDSLVPPVEWATAIRAHFEAYVRVTNSHPAVLPGWSFQPDFPVKRTASLLRWAPEWVEITSFVLDTEVVGGMLVAKFDRLKMLDDLMSPDLYTDLKAVILPDESVFVSFAVFKKDEVNFDWGPNIYRDYPHAGFGLSFSRFPRVAKNLEILLAQANRTLDYKADHITDGEQVIWMGFRLPIRLPLKAAKL